jgi:hypothetical protein
VRGFFEEVGESIVSLSRLDRFEGGVTISSGTVSAEIGLG